MRPLQMGLPALISLILLFGGCSQEARNERFFKELQIYANQYSSGDPKTALEALAKDIALLERAPSSVISKEDKLWWISFSEVRLSMIHAYLGDGRKSDDYMSSALGRFNKWRERKGLSAVSREQLLASVVACDQEFRAPWHPGLQKESN